jgi:AbrB family looped-hinge helix DNA binding protein
MTDVETAKMSERGQIIIPKDIREYVDAKENTIFTIMPIDRDTIIMKKLDKEQLVKEFRSIRAGVKEKMAPKDISEEIRQSRK